MKILLAEDEKDMSAALVAILTHSGYEVDPVYDGEAAVQMAQRHSYDCMVFDIMMPKLDGVQALQKIRDGGDVTPVIMLTAKSEVADRINGLDAGADDYLTRPVPCLWTWRNRNCAVPMRSVFRQKKRSSCSYSC